MLANKDFEGLSDRLTHWAEFLKVTIPYKNTAEFVEMLRKNSVIEVIAS
jgi:hypothetical protein